jgi:hypothetical protein
MRNTDSIPSIDLAELTTVTGGCKRKQPAPPPPQPPPQQMAPPPPSGVEITVATGAQAAQLISAATQGSAAPAAPRTM